MYVLGVGGGGVGRDGGEDGVEKQELQTYSRHELTEFFIMAFAWPSKRKRHLLPTTSTPAPPPDFVF